MEREWLDFGHKFGERCGHQPGHDDVNERCPVFAQWLDAVHQLLRQYPTAFEFNETFLVRLCRRIFTIRKVENGAPLLYIFIFKFKKKKKSVKIVKMYCEDC